MQAFDFISKWERSELKESAAAQSHFVDLCHLLGVETPTDVDAVGDTYCFEKGATKSTGGQGFADVWKKGCFGWEYKGPKANLDAAHNQLLHYAVALENPPLLIVSDTKTIIVRTNWTNTVSEKHEIVLTDLLDAGKRELLRNCFVNPDALKPKRTRDDLTREAANEFSALAQRLRDRGHEPETVAHFVNRLVFCMFAEDVGLLPNKMFERAVEFALKEPGKAQQFLTKLFAAMNTGGEVGFEAVPYFNGGLFDTDEALPLDKEDVKLVHNAAKLFWGDIDPSILGTLFERGLDPSKRSQLGAHYTDRDKIMMIVRPVIIEPLEAEWAEARAKITDEMEKSRSAKSAGAQTQAYNRAVKAHGEFIEKLARFRVLDPACGSGNFLYLSLKALKDIEHKANVEAEALGLPRGFPRVGPEAVKGIELNPYAAELARVSIWIGEIQWMRANGFDAVTKPILKPLNNIECRDAIKNPDGTEAVWPAVDVIVGNPPFLGAKLMKGSLGVTETERIREIFAGRLPGFTDLVCYWFEKSRDAITSNRAQRAGLVATNSIAKNTNLPVLRRIKDDLEIYEAYADEPWVVEGAAVRVALISFAPKAAVKSRKLNGVYVESVNANLTAGLDISTARPLEANRGQSMLGIQKSGPFDVDGKLARVWMQLPINPNGFGNAAVLKPYWNGDDLTSRPRDMWFIDLPRGVNEGDAALFEAPFRHLCTAHYDPKKPEEGSLRVVRGTARDDHARVRWWEPYWPRPEMRRLIEALPRYLVTAETAQYRLFAWLSYPTLPDKNLIVVARDDDTAFGILHSRFHEKWALSIGSSLEDRPRYTSSTTFETFPFPEGLTPNIPAAVYADDPRAQAIATAAARLNKLRENWLNPPDLVRRVPEVVPGYPDRILPVNDEAEAILKKRTLTNLYNERPAWLEHAHRDLDRAVAAAYGWEADFEAGLLTDDEILKRLFELNQERAAKQ
ncbi:class I SAM-dependent DNA methyltransferase [Hyphomonas jannaschiana]|uniref:class I SAM-dependent DNA methyltransferase n=1 Tax=Hyphomonas jannaschiana TaxID=86 RepID=UPI0035C6B201